MATFIFWATAAHLIILFDLHGRDEKQTLNGTVNVYKVSFQTLSSACSQEFFSPDLTSVFLQHVKHQHTLTNYMSCYAFTYILDIP